MMNRPSIITLAIFLVMGVGNASAQHKWTLEECQKYAYEHNTDIKLRGVAIQQKDLSISIARNDRLPIVTGAAQGVVDLGETDKMLSIGTDNNRNTLADVLANVNAEMPIFDGFSVKNRIKQGKFSLQAATADLEQAQKDLGIQVATYYLNCLYYRSTADVQEKQVEVSRNLVNRARILFEEGKKPEADLKSAMAQLAQDEYQLTDARGNERLALMDLCQLLDINTLEGFDVADVEGSQELPLMNAQGIYDQCVEHYPSIVSAQKQISASEAGIEVARAGYYPKLSAIGAVSTGYKNTLNSISDVASTAFPYTFGNMLYGYIGVKLTVPIFNRHSTRNDIKNAQLDVLNNQLNLDNAKLKLHKDIQTAYTNALVAKDKLASAEKAVASADIAAQYEQDRYEGGRGNIFDLQTAQQKQLNARQQAVQAKYEYLIRLRILEFYK